MFIEYKGYIANVSYDPKEKSFYGSVTNISDVINFQTGKIDLLMSEFEASIADYILFCKENDIEPMKPNNNQIGYLKLL